MKIPSSILLILLSFIAYSQNSEKYIDAGYEKYDEEDYQGAILDFNKAESYDKANPEIFYLRGVCKSLLGNKREAMTDLQKATSLKPEYAEAHYEMGYIYLTDQNAKEAIKAFDNTIKYMPEFAEAYVSRGTAKCMLEDKVGANADWEKAKELGVAYSDYMVCE